MGKNEGNSAERVGDNLSEIFDEGDPERMFTSIQEVGHGSFGSVFRAKHAETGYTFAIKKLKVQKSSDDLEDAIKEIKAMTACKHPNVVEFFGAYLKGTSVWLAMEYCIGSASDILEVFKGPLSEVEIASVAKGVVNALGYLHKKGFIHRDVKAANILLKEDGTVKIGDFGSASLASPANSFIGTPYWMAPEVILAMESGTYGGSADVWALGITCLELGEMKPPLIDMHAMSALYHIPQNDPPHFKEPEKWSSAFNDFLKRCLEKDADARASADALGSHPLLTSVVDGNAIIESIISRSKIAVKEVNKEHFVSKVNELRNAVCTEDEDDSGSTGLYGSSDTGTIDSISSVKSSNLSVDSKSSSTDINFMSPILSPTAVESPPAHRQVYPRVQTPTIRSERVVSEERAYEKMAERDALKRQLKELQRLQKSHQKFLNHLQKQHEDCVEEDRKSQMKEYEALLRSHDHEMEKLLSRQKKEDEEFTKKETGETNEQIKRLESRRRSAVREFSSNLKKRLKSISEERKRERESSPKPERVDLKKQHEEEISGLEQEEIAKVEEKERIHYEAAMKEHYAQQLEKRRDMEWRHLLEQLDLKGICKEQQRHMKHRHHRLYHEMISVQMKERHKLVREQQQKQQEVEWQNLIDSQAEEEKRADRKQILDIKQHPKEMKSIKTRLKKQYNKTVKVQVKQSKAQLKLLLKNRPKSEHAELMRRQKEEDMYRMSRLAEQFSKLWNDQLTSKTRKMDLDHTCEYDHRRAKHEKEKESLIMYHNLRKKLIETAQSKELDDFRQKQIVENSALDRIFSAEKTQFGKYCEDQKRALLREQGRLKEK
eukprot:Nk52_evm28s2367 gene=Nk52_evmTU28s2367